MRADSEPPVGVSTDIGTNAGVPLTLSCPQAIFTSIRSPMGQGYRLIVASRSVKAEEKIEITRRSPSHGSLCDPSADAAGLLSYSLATDRQCVACCIHAGVEHTARGGLRVYSHIALFEPAEFEAVGADPLRIHAAMLEQLRRNGAILSPPPCLEPLSLTLPPLATPKNTAAAGAEATEPPMSSTPSNSVADDAPASPDPASLAIAADLRAGRNVIVTGATEPMSLLRSLMELLPLDARRQLSMSAGLNYSPGRRLQLVILPDEDTQLRRLTAGLDVVIHRLAHA